MRALASRLHVEPMSLYSHFASKEDLLAEVAARVLLEIDLPDSSLPARERLVRLSRALRRLGHLHPNAFSLIVLMNQRIQPVLRVTETALRAFLDAGLPDRDAIQAQRTLLGFVRGYTLWEIGGFATGRRPGPGQRPHELVIAELRALDAHQFPSVVRLAEPMVRYSPDDEFDKSVDIILAAALASGANPRSPARAPRRS
jgi:AcrR family transcriptional regulator